ncbi:MAG: hypothetical protein HRU26_12315, partial [Psychroserpens sp.]|nr:hypothetical protein [Psychroserpens sp.]
RRVDPDVFILAESEFWPNLLREAQRHTRAVILINGRIYRIRVFAMGDIDKWSVFIIIINNLK